jgi:fructosamine-3-kinase
MLPMVYWIKFKMTFSQKIKDEIESVLGFKISSLQSLSGGCISNAYKLTLQNKSVFFLKHNSGAKNKMFIKEANGLNELKKANAIRVPSVIKSTDEYILLEFIESGHRNKKFIEDFGRRFAELHKCNSNQFGFYEDSFIGSNEQVNIPNEEEKNNWVKFYFNKRILFQLKLAEKNGYATSELRNAVSSLENKIEDVIGKDNDKPSLLHGDLWGGNYMVDENGNACLIDPAVYYGHREADLAMTKLFGGFGDSFYSAYKECFPLDDGYEYRENIYKLYHVLNHLNLFGGGYYSQAISLMSRYV